MGSFFPPWKQSKPIVQNERMEKAFGIDGNVAKWQFLVVDKPSKEILANGISFWYHMIPWFFWDAGHVFHRSKSSDINIGDSRWYGDGSEWGDEHPAPATRFGCEQKQGFDPIGSCGWISNCKAIFSRDGVFRQDLVENVNTTSLLWHRVQSKPLQEQSLGQFIVSDYGIFSLHSWFTAWI